MSQRGKSARASVLHEVSESLDVLCGVIRRYPAAGQDPGLDQLHCVPPEPVRSGRRRSLTNLTFVLLVAREWMRRRLATKAARSGATLEPGTEPCSAVSEGTAQHCEDVSWTAAPVWAAEPEGATEPSWAVDPEWAAETEAADHDRARW